MKLKLLNQLLLNGLISSAILLTPKISHAALVSLNFTPYLGVEAGMQNFGFKTGYGDNVFKKQLPKGNLFVGAKFNDYLGLECGYETTTQGTKKVNIGYGADKYLGVNSNTALGVDAPGEFGSIYSKVKISGWHLGFTGYYQFAKLNNKLSVIGYAGIKNAKVKLSAIQYQVNGEPYVVAHDFSAKEKLFKFALGLSYCSMGLQYALSEHLGIRTILSWENTSKFKPTFKPNLTTYQAKLKNSFNYSIGLIFI